MTRKFLRNRNRRGPIKADAIQRLSPILEPDPQDKDFVLASTLQPSNTILVPAPWAEQYDSGSSTMT